MPFYDFSFTDTARYLFSKDGFWLPVKADLINTMNYYKSVANITSFGLYGFCWGAKMIVYASADTENFSGINAIGFVHPSRVTTQDANEINAPAMLLPSNAEADMVFQDNHLRESLMRSTYLYILCVNMQ